MSSKLLYTGIGIGGQLELWGDRVVIKRSGAVAAVSGGLEGRLGDKTIPLSQISAVQFRKATMMFNGYISFSFFGGREINGYNEAAKNENSVIFYMWNQKPFLLIKSSLDAYLAEGENETEDEPVSDYNNLEELAELRDKGIITAADFDAKKKQILGI